MGVNREWRCAAHGEFESTTGDCPYGCSKRFVVREIRTAPAYHDGRTRNIDRTLDGLAGSVGLTDMSNRNGSVMNSQRAPPGRDGPDFSPKWVDIPHATPGWSQREGEKSPVVGMEHLGQPGMQAANIAEQFKKAGIIDSGAQDFHGRGPSIAASKEANLFVGHAKREDLE